MKDALNENILILKPLDKSRFFHFSSVCDCCFIDGYLSSSSIEELDEYADPDCKYCKGTGYVRHKIAENDPQLNWEKNQTPEVIIHSCKKCNVSGNIYSTRKKQCSNCRGNGWIENNSEIKICSVCSGYKYIHSANKKKCDYCQGKGSFPNVIITQVATIQCSCDHGLELSYQPCDSCEGSGSSSEYAEKNLSILISINHWKNSNWIKLMKLIGSSSYVDGEIHWFDLLEFRQSKITEKDFSSATESNDSDITFKESSDRFNLCEHYLKTERMGIKPDIEECPNCSGSISKDKNCEICFQKKRLIRLNIYSACGDCNGYGNEANICSSCHGNASMFFWRIIEP